MSPTHPQLCCLLLQGWVLYLDGQQAAQITHAVTDLRQLQTPGGDPLLINNSVHLCGRADSELDRFFDGTLAALSFFNQSLMPADVSWGMLPCLHLFPACMRCLLLLAAVAAGSACCKPIVSIALAAFHGPGCVLCMLSLGVLLSKCTHGTHCCRTSKVVLPICTCCMHLPSVQDVAGLASCDTPPGHAAALVDAFCWQHVLHNKPLRVQFMA